MDAQGESSRSASSRQTNSQTSQSSPPTVTSQSSPPSTSSPPTAASPTQIAEARAAVTATLSSVGAHIDHDLQTRASTIHSNRDAIAKQEAELVKQTAGLKKTTEKMQKEMDGSLKKLKELGDVQNWTEVLERDLLVLEETMRLVEGGEDGGWESGTNGLVRK